MAAQYRPCDSGKEINIYCVQWNECHSDGSRLNDQGHTIYRDGCDDPFWKSSSCVKLCNVELESGNDENDLRNVTSGTYGITMCENGSYCCGNSAFADTCCALNHGVFMGNESIARQDPISFQSSLTSGILSTSIGALTPITSSLETPSQTLSNFPSSPTSFALSSPQKAALHTGAILGGTFGTIGGVAALTLCTLIWKRRRRRIRQAHQNEMMQQPVISGLTAPFDVPNLFELYGDNTHGEMDGADMILELDPSRTWHEVQ